MSKIKGSNPGLPKNGHWGRSLRCNVVVRRRAQRRGVTLIELVIVVAMVGILASLASVGYSRYIRSAKTAEATQMLGSIKSAQEAFKSETFKYLNVSKDLTTPYPQGDRDVGKDKYAWAGGLPDSARANFESLGVTSSGPVQYGYACVAGSAADQMPELPLDFETPDWPDPGGPWYVAVAWADFDVDGVEGGYATSSLAAQIVSVNEGE